jgi:antitoxin (DNA-binding transcriptional repressor) of toxin-antitoxin stability system
MSKTVPLAEVASLDALLDEIEQTREEVVITRDGKEVAKVSPISDELRGPMFGRIRFLGDIVEPIEKWDCDE